MTKVIVAETVDEALAQGLAYLSFYGIKEESRNGPVIVAPGPVITEYTKPWQRVIFNPVRDANPFFHLMEAMWMLEGRRDVAYLERYNSKFGQFSDDGEIVHGAYGFRWREWFGFDQLDVLIEELKSNPNTRRAVLTMWSPNGDLITAPRGGGPTSKDLPCNTQVYFDARGGALNMTVCCRSNDIYWGAYGANAVHFSFLQEYMAIRVGVNIGVYRQVSNNYHMYPAIVGDNARVNELIRESKAGDDYALHNDHGYMMNIDPVQWHKELSHLMSCPAGLQQSVDITDPFLAGVVAPMALLWDTWKAKASFDWAKGLADSTTEPWLIAAFDWLYRREVEV